jgi:hypothetical protein
MANFLNRLAARAIGSASVAKPVISTIFSPSSIWEGSGPPAEVAEESIISPTEQSAATRSASANVLPKEQEISSAKAAPLFESASLPAYEERPLRRESTPAPNTGKLARQHSVTQPLVYPSHTQPPESGIHVTDHVSPSMVPAKSHSSSHEGNTTEPLVAWIPARRQQPALSANRTASPSRPYHAASPAHAAPVVRVTIGRIDVRAQFSSPPPAPAATRSARPAALSLDEYLKQRSEGKR